MPIIKNSSYQKPHWMINRHLETILPGVLRKVPIKRAHSKMEIPTTDGDFLELDWYLNKRERLVIISHGLEGDSKRPYTLGLVKKFTDNGWDAMAWNYRGCGEKMNRTKKFYNSGATYDLETVVNYAIKMGYKQIALTGVSLGGNLSLKYLGERELPEEVKVSAVFSVPLDLAGCSAEIDKSHNFLYSSRFLTSLKEKVKAKAKIFPDEFDVVHIESLKTIYDFDDVVTAPLHGFENADDYYKKCSAINFISNIKIPALVVNALNDPFLPKSCYQTTNFESSENVYFEMPKFGGHVGFSTYGNGGTYWSEERAFEFISKHVN